MPPGHSSNRPGQGPVVGRVTQSPYVRTPMANPYAGRTNESVRNDQAGQRAMALSMQGTGVPQNVLDAAAAGVQANNAATGATAGGNNGGGGRGSGGGGKAGPTPEQIRALADEVFAFNAAPYDAQRAGIATQRGQVEGYNPDFTAMGAEYQARQQAAEQQRAAAIQQRLDATGQLGAQLAGQGAQAMAGAARDLGGQGFGIGGYMDQANAMGADRQALLANQGNFLGDLNALSANSLADYIRGSGLITQGGQATLANNRGVALNTLGQREADIGVNQAKDQAANEQARREFLLKYGLGV